MREFYKAGSRNKLPMGGYPVQFSKMDFHGKELAGVSVAGLFASNTMIPVRTDEAGQPLIRWEEAVGWTETPWDEVVKTRPEEPVVVKVVAVVDDYYNYDYRDEVKWLCVCEPP